MSCTCNDQIKKNKNKNNTKQFTVFVNGNNFDAHKIVINPKKICKWHHILGEITQKVNPNFGVVKKLYSSESGVTLNSFTDLQNNGVYIASDNRKFQLIKGGYKTPESQKIEYLEHYLTDQLDHINKVKKLSHVRRDLIVIYVFNNGKHKEPPAKFVLSKDDLHNWQHTLSFIALILDTPYRDIKFLYNVKGHAICGPWELQHGASYVAVGFHEKFIKRNYKIRMDTTETWIHDVPVIHKDKNLPCFHSNNITKSWKQNIKWKHYSTDDANQEQSAAPITVEFDFNRENGGITGIAKHFDCDFYYYDTISKNASSAFNMNNAVERKCAKNSTRSRNMDEYSSFVCKCPNTTSTSQDNGYYSRSNYTY